MTRDDVMALSGRELDAAVAERVMGYVPYLIPFYSSNLTAAWEVVEAMDRYTCDFSLEKAGTLWHAEFMCVAASGDTAAEAICRAALLALDEPVPLAPKTETV